MKKNSVHGFLVALLFSIISCNKDVISDPYTYNPPVELNDGINVSHLDSVGLDRELLEYMVENMSDFKYIHSVLICKNEKLVLEEYFLGYNKSSLNNMYSVTKSVCSALVGIAIDKQYIHSVNDPVHLYFPEYAINWAGKEDIKICNLLTMSSGLKWDEDTAPYTSSDNSHSQMDKSPDQVKFVLERPVADRPGSKWVYNSGGVTALGKIISNASGMDLDTFATRNLFKPLGIVMHEWYKYPSGIYLSSGNLKLISRDMLKFGLLYLNYGKWNGQQIIPSEWISASVQDQITTSQSQVRYGYLWWKRPLLMLNGQRIEGYTAEGFGGQFIFVLPSFHMVVVITSGIDWNQEELTYQPVEILQQFILPAIN
jgi:CubicO group peptidase (beta-lactamase class C family)